MTGLAWGQSTEVYPKPVSESVEQTGPGQMVFLSYPKYYRDAAQQLKPVNTTLVESSDPDWEYEVTTGIWSLHVRRDGTFQARHEGDVFTYRFDLLGIDRGSNFRPFNLGKANFENISVFGNTVRWYNVYPDVDLSIQYIPHILKVDVVVKAAFTRELRSEVQTGSLNREEFITARFAIPNILVSNEARQGGKPVDLYVEHLDSNQHPIEFIKDKITNHQLLVSESYVLDENGNRVYPDDTNGIKPIRTEQLWQLRQNQAGIAESSANLGDLADSPEGDLVIDPSVTFSKSTGSTMDARLVYGSSSHLGGQSTIPLSANDHAVIACDMNSFSRQKEISNVKLIINIASNTLTSDAQMKAYNVTNDWWEAAVDWYDAFDNMSWATAGGDYDSANPETQLTISQGYTGTKEFDITAPFKARYPSALHGTKYRGFLLKYENSPGGQVTFTSKEGTSNWWSIQITYTDASGRPQEIWHQPFLYRRDGDKNTVSDRYFPIGTWYNITKTSDLYNVAAQTSYGPLLNTISALGKVDPHYKQSPPYSADVLAQIVSEQVIIDMANELNLVYSQLGVDYKLIPYLTDRLQNADLVTHPEFSNPVLPWEILSEVTYYPNPGTYSVYNECQAVNSAVSNSTIQNHARIIGWTLGDEPYGGMGATNAEATWPGHRSYLHDIMLMHKTNIFTLDNGKRPISLDLRGWGNYFDHSVGDTIYYPAFTWLDDLDVQDQIFDSSLYMLDLFNGPRDNLNRIPWQNAIYQVETVMNHVIEPHNGKAYCRFVGCRNDVNGNLSPSDPDFKNEKYRYLIYSSWVAGGQGLNFFRIEDPQAPNWFGSNNSGISGLILQEADAMKDWIINSPATDSRAFIRDGSNQRLRFILRRDQNNPTNRILVLLCNFANDSNYHYTYIDFPDYSIGSISKVKPYMDGTYTVVNNHTLCFEPTNMDSSDVYGSACFLTLSN